MIDTHSKAKQTEEKRSDEDTEKTEKMETKTEEATAAATETKETQNADQGGTPKTEQTTEQMAGDPPKSDGEPTGDGDKEYVTRADMQQMVKDEVTAAIAPVTEQMTKLGESLQTVAETMKTVTDSVTDMKGKVEEFDSATITRSDVGDGEVAKETKVDRNDPFAGCFGNMGGLRQ